MSDPTCGECEWWAEGECQVFDTGAGLNFPADFPACYPVRALVEARAVAIKVEGLQRAEIELQKDEIEELREKLDFLRSECPEDRDDNDPGFTQAEAYFWKQMAELNQSEVDRLRRERDRYRKALEKAIKFLDRVEAHMPKRAVKSYERLKRAIKIIKNFLDQHDDGE